MKKVIFLNVNHIFVNTDQPRKTFYQNSLTELSRSIEKYGILQPLIVHKISNDNYKLIAGERRLRAAINLGMDKVPVFVVDYEERDLAVISLIENVQRENLNFIEEAYAYKRLLEDYHFTQVELAEKVGKNQSTISNKLRLLTLPLEILNKLTKNNLSERHARALLRLDEEDLEPTLNRVISKGLTVSQTEAFVDSVLSKKKNIKREHNKTNYYSYKVYRNTMKLAFSQIHDVEQDVAYYEEDMGEYLEIRVVIPKKRRCFT